jgi:hypothetical protein
MSIQESLTTVLRAPTPTALWQLRGDMLQLEFPSGSPAWKTLDRFFDFLNELYASMSAHEFSKYATRLDIGAVGGVALERVLEAELSPSDLWKRLLLGGVSEGLMVLASRQYVKAFLAETSAVFESATWFLYQELWSLSRLTQPDIDSALRRKVIDTVLAPVHAQGATSSMKAVLIGRIFQVLLLVHLRIAQDEVGEPR